MFFIYFLHRYPPEVDGEAEDNEDQIYQYKGVSAINPDLIPVNYSDDVNIFEDKTDAIILITNEEKNSLPEKDLSQFGNQVQESSVQDLSQFDDAVEELSVESLQRNKIPETEAQSSGTSIRKV